MWLNPYSHLYIFFKKKAAEKTAAKFFALSPPQLLSFHNFRKNPFRLLKAGIGYRDI